MASRGLGRSVITLIVVDAVLILVLIAMIITHPSGGPQLEQEPVSPQATESPDLSPEPEEEPEPEDEGAQEEAEDDTDPAAEAPEDFDVPEGVLSEPAFATPSGNIWCDLTTDGATCTIGGHEYGVPDQPDCDEHTGRVLQVTESGASMPCVAQAPPTSAPESHVELDYGESTMVGDFLCSSAETGVTCRSLVAGHGFELAYADYSIF